MCVICVKPAGAKMPDYTTIMKCMDKNPDGFGVATLQGIYKTLDPIDFICKLEMIPQSEPCIIHCRWATHGSVKESNCHPFIDEKSGVMFAHNGVLPIPSIKDKTDSETAFVKFFVPVIRKYGLSSPRLDLAVKNIIGFSKFAFMNKQGKLRLFGSFIKRGDLFFSNVNWDR